MGKRIYRRRTESFSLFPCFCLHHASVSPAAAGDTEVFCMLSVRNVSITHEKDLRPLIDNLSFTLSGKERLAVIGEEGNGKSTLLKAIFDPDSISSYAHVTGIISAPGEKLGYLPQELPEKHRMLPVYEYCMLHDAFCALNPRALSQLCTQVRLSGQLPFSMQPLYTLSGGEKVKLQLLLLLSQEPTMLLLDEPGNDLDLGTLRFLEHFLVTCDLPVLYISHDETLLSRTASRILHLEMAYHKTTPRWTLSNTPYDTYMQNRRRALSFQEQQAQNEKRQERIRQEKFERIQQAVEHAQNAISRQDPHGGRLLKKKMKAVKSLEKRYEREKEDQTQRPNVEYAIDAAFEGDNTVPIGKTVLDLFLPELQMDGRCLSQNISLRMTGPEKVIIIGKNDCGKTTLLSHIAALLTSRKDLRAVYMPQRYEDLLDESLTPVAFLHTRGDKEQLTKVRTYLGAMKLTRDEMNHPIRDLSGGQKAKLLLLRMILQEANVLILDEPTRNLSPLSAPVFRDMITSFQGAVLCVTHDRKLMDMWPGRILYLDEKGLREALETERT